MEDTTYEIELPAHWAPFIFNDDSSGMDDDDIAKATREIQEHTQDGYVIVDADLDYTFHSRYRGLMYVMAEYTVTKR